MRCARTSPAKPEFGQFDIQFRQVEQTEGRTGLGGYCQFSAVGGKSQFTG